MKFNINILFVFVIALLFAVFQQANAQTQATPDNAITIQGVIVTIAVLNNDLGANLAVSIVDNANHGIVTVQANQTVVYNPNFAFIGTDTFKYRITNTVTAAFSEALVLVQVQGQNLPVAQNDVAYTPINTSVLISVLSNDNGNNISLLNNSISNPANGTATANNDGTITYTPNNGFVGTDAFLYGISDANMQSTTASVTVFVGGNQPPLVDTMYYCTAAQSPVAICNSFTDPNGDPVKIDVINSHTTFHCSLTALNDTCIRYTPLPGFIGVDTVYIVVCDNQTPKACSTSVAYITVGACPKPVGNNDLVIITETSVVTNNVTTTNNNALNYAVLPVLNNDFDPCGNNLSITTITDAPSHGTTQIINGQIVYDVNNNYSGNDALQYVVCNQCPKCDTVNVIMQINANICTFDKSVCLAPFSSIELCPLFCDVNIETAGSLSAFAIQGMIIPSANEHCYTYIPDADFSSTDEVTFIACQNGLCDTTTYMISINAQCGTNPPLAINDYASTQPGTAIAINVLNNDSEPDGDILTITFVGNPSCGTASTSNGVILYSPFANCTANIDSFKYIICDGTNKCDTAMVYVTLNGDVNCNVVLEFCTINFMNPIDICAYFCDTPGADTIFKATTTFNCSIAYLNDTCIRYTPLPGFEGTDTVKLIGCNTQGLCDTVYAIVHVGCTAPVANDDEATVTQPNSVDIPVLLNDNSVCDKPLSTSIILQPAHGTASTNPNGTINYNPTDGYQGTDEFLYVSCNVCGVGDAQCDTAKVVVTVIDNSNTEPLNAEPDVKTTPFETPITFNVLQNDTGTGLTVSSNTNPENGNISLQPNGTATYTPNPGFSGVDHFFYTVCDALQSCQTVIVTITVLPPNTQNQAPNAVNDVVQTPVNTTIPVPVTLNDSDPENQPLTLTITTAPMHGTAVVQPNGVIAYTPFDNYIGLDTLEYKICDNGTPSLCDEATLVIGINTPLNQPPVGTDNSAYTDINQPVTINVIADDTDPNIGDILSVLPSSNPENGTVVYTPQGEAIYTPEPGFVGTDYFTYLVCDNGIPVLCDVVAVEITVGNINQPPVALNDTFTTTVNTPINTYLLQNDSDPDNDTTQLTITVIEQAAHGTAQAVNGNYVTYNPTNNYVGTDTFKYQICDPENACDTAIVIITIVPVVSAQPDLAFTEANTPVTIPVLNNDLGDNITIKTILDTPDNGSITDVNPNTGEVIYTPNPGFVGTDYFTYVICDNLNHCDTTVVAVTVMPQGMPNHPPTANNDVTYTQPNTPLIINPIENDNDPDNDPITITAIEQQPTQGTVVINPDGTVTYTPNPNVQQVCDIFSYIVCDNGTPSLCDTAFVQVGIGTSNCLNNPPNALPDEATTNDGTPVNINVLTNDTEPDNDPITLILASNPAHGTVIENNNLFTYTPEDGFVGIDYFTYIICDNQMPKLCDTTYVTITVLPQGVNAEPDIAYTPINTPVDINVLPNDEGTAIQLVDIVTNPDFGTLEVYPFDGIVTYTPNPDFVGIDYFEYQICGANNDCDITVVTIIVLPDTITNIAPNAVDDIDETPVNTPILVDIVNNDNDPFGGNDLTILSTEQPNNGTVTIINDSSVVYAPKLDFVGVDSFTYIVCDNGTPILCDTATVFIYVNTQLINNQEVIAIDDFDETTINTPIDIPVLANDFDPDGDDFVITLITEPGHGTASDPNNDGLVTYTPNPGFTGTDFFTYIICDNGTPTACDTAYVTILVAGDTILINDTTLEETPIEICLENYVTEGLQINNIDVTELPQSGSIIIVGTCVQYFPEPDTTGNVNMVFLACDENQNCIPIQINITILPIPDPPVAKNDTDTTLLNTPIIIAVLNNDSDPDGDLLPIALINIAPTNGIATPNNDGTITYTPNPNFIGLDSFRYAIFDSTGLSDTAWVFIFVDSTDAPPPVNTIEAITDFATTDMGMGVTIPILANDTLPDGTNAENTTIVFTDLPSHGTPVLNANQTVTYVPTPGFSGIDTFEYQVCVALIDTTICDTTQVIVTITAPENCEIIVPNVFTPNDDTVNDLFLIEGIGVNCNQGNIYHLMIFNRWGDIVYEKEQYANSDAWNGTLFNKGTPVPDGTYYYVLWYMNETSENDITGYITLRR